MSSSKHFIQDPVELVRSALRSLAHVNPHVAVDEANKIVYRRPQQQQQQHQDKNESGRPQVSLVSGGGSGHEPSFSGMVGPGMLSAAVAGTIFASPSAEQVRTAIMSRVDVGGGVLVVVMNYTGDVLNFGVAVEKAKAAGVDVEMVVVGDDVAVGRAKGGKVGRRGIAGTTLLLKIAGAAAAGGASLAQVAGVARLAADNVASVGVSLEHVHVPGRGEADEANRLPADRVEMGMGIHNEPGSRRAELDLRELVRAMVGQLLDDADEDRAFVRFGRDDRLVLLVNNLGGVSPLEMAAITHAVVAQLHGVSGMRPLRVLSGTFMTSLNGPGFSISLLRLVDTPAGVPDMLELLDAPSEVTGWSAPIRAATWEAPSTATREDDAAATQTVQPSGLNVQDVEGARAALKRALESVVAAEPEITKYDTVVGDGDCGTGMKRGAQAILEHLEQNPLTGDAVVDVASIVPVVEKTMDGTSGALYTIFLHALVHALRATESPAVASPQVWASALQKSCDALAKYTPARPGDRTLIDALYPFVQTLDRTGSVDEAAAAAKVAADETKGMRASLGRTVYVGGSGYEQVPDPGAYGLACFFQGLANSAGR